MQAFVDNFEVLAKAEGGVRSLRDLVLDLAVKGALVPQDENEGTGDALANQLQAARQTLSASVRSDLPPVTPKDEPHAIPASWRWVRLANFGGLLGGGTPAKSHLAFWQGSIPWVSPKDMKRPYIDDAEDHISEAAVERTAVKLIPQRSVLFVVRGMILAHSFPVALTTKPVTINQDMKALVLAAPDTGEYLLRACWAARSRVLAAVARSSHGTCRLDTEAVEGLPIPLPPLAEQKRIVAKVDELMRLLDDLEAKQTTQRETQTRFRSAALDALTSAEGPAEMAAAWGRVAENFGMLAPHSEDIAHLRAAVLELAIRGKLSASSSVRTKASPGVLFDLPTDWRWSTVEDVATLVTDGEHLTPPRVDSGVPLVTAKNVRDGYMDFSLTDFVEPEVAARCWRRCHPQLGDVLMVCVGATTGRVCVLSESRDFVLVRSVALLRPDDGQVDSSYLSIVLRSPTGQRQIWSSVKEQAQPCLYINRMKRLRLPIPPLPEQQRIVAKVEHLMKLCDELEAKLQQADETAEKLVEAVVAELVAA